MIDQLIQQLNSPDPVQRRAAIVALANARDPAALKSLAAIYQSDPDPALRELALKAGRYLQQFSQSGQAGDQDQAAAGAASDQAAEDRPVSQRDVERAKGYLDAAIGHHTGGDQARAVENLGKALSLNPALHKESFVANLIITLTGQPVAAGLRLLVDPAARSALIAQLGGKVKLKAQPKAPDADTATWNNVLLDASLYWIISALSTIALVVFAISMLQDLIDQLPTTPTAPGTASVTAADLDFLRDMSFVALIPTALINGLYSVIGAFIYGAAVHFVATSLLGGTGTLVYLYRKLIPFQTYVTLILAAAIAIIGLSGSMELFAVVMGAGSLLGSIIMLYMLASIVGKAYDFGTATGCGAIILGSILLVVVGGCGWCLLFSAAGRLAGGG